MDPTRKRIWNLTPRQVDAELRKAGIDPRPTLEAIEKLMWERVHHDEEEDRGFHHLAGGMIQIPTYGSKAA